MEETTRVLAQASTSTNSRDVLTLEVHAVNHTASESLPLAALLDNLDPLVFTLPPTTPLLPSVDAQLPALLAMDKSTSLGKPAHLPLVTQSTTAVELTAASEVTGE